MAIIIVTISVMAIVTGMVIFEAVSSFLFNRRVAKYHNFAAELEAKEDEWERIRRRGM